MRKILMTIPEHPAILPIVNIRINADKPINAPPNRAETGVNSVTVMDP
jgi:hypothetical protein